MYNKKDMSSRFQAPSSFTQVQTNPNLTPLPPQVDPWASRGRFQQVNLGTNPAEERTRLPDNVTFERRNIFVPPVAQNETVKSDNSNDQSGGKVVKKEETVTTTTTEA